MTQDMIAQFEQRSDELIQFIENTLNDLHRGEMPDFKNMKDIENQVSVLCDKVSKSSPEVAREVQPLMSQMIGRLDALAQALIDFKQTAEERHG